MLKVRFFLNETDEYFELDLPVAPAVMVGDETVAGSLSKQNNEPSKFLVNI